MLALRGIVAGALGLLAAGCATAPQQMHWYAEGRAPAEAPGWPAPPAEARLAWTGELLGETNFRAAEGSRDPAGMRLLRWIVGLGGRRDEILELQRPQSGAVDALGRILVTDAGRQAVMVFDPAAGALDVWTDAARGRSFAVPVGICVQPDGDVYVADADLGRIVRLRADGTPAGQFGAGELARPTGLACDGSRGELYVADSAAHVVRVYGAGGTLLRTLGGPGTAPGEFNGPTHLAFASDRLYVTDTLNARVQVLTRDGRHLETIGSRGLYVGNLVRPKGVTTDRDGNVYVIESYYDHLLIYNGAGDLLLPIGGTGDGVGQFFLPAGAWTDDGDRLFVADMFNGRVIVLDYLGDPG